MQVAAASLVAEHYTGVREQLPALHVLDAMVAGWLADGPHRVHVNTLVNAAGVAFGAHVARDAGLEWVIATDEHGSDLALHGAPGDVLVHPANAVAKRVVAGESGFVVALHAELVDGVRRRRAAG